MVETKFVINDTKTGKSYQKTLEENPYLNKKVGEKVEVSAPAGKVVYTVMSIS